MCGNEPCAHERGDATGDAMKSYVAASALAGDAAIERDKALAKLAKIAALCDDAEDRFDWLAVDRIRGVLEPTPKGTKP